MGKVRLSSKTGYKMVKERKMAKEWRAEMSYLVIAIVQGLIFIGLHLQMLRHS